MTYTLNFPKALKGSEVGEWFIEHLDMQEPTNTEVYSELKRRAALVCPEGFHMTIRGQDEWAAIAEAVNQGIDAHLEAFTRSTFDNGSIWLHPEEAHTLIRRMAANATKRANDHYRAAEAAGEDMSKYIPLDDEGEVLARDIVYALFSDD